MTQPVPNFKPIVTRCAAVTDESNPTGSRCTSVPDRKNGYFCSRHWNELHHTIIPAIIIRGMPHVVRKAIGVAYVGVVKKEEKPKVHKKVADKPAEPISTKSKIIDETSDVNKGGNALEQLSQVKQEPDKVQEKKSDPEKDKKSYINSKIDEFKDLGISDLKMIAKSLGIKGRYNKKKLIMKIVEKEMEAENDHAG